MLTATVRPGEKLVYSTRWTDPEADRSDMPEARGIPVEIVITCNDERHEALSQRPSLFSFLKRDIRSHVCA